MQIKNIKDIGYWVPMAILTAWETEIGRIMVGGQPRQIFLQIPPPK
jgi:hypothetical protein